MDNPGKWEQGQHQVIHISDHTLEIKTWRMIRILNSWLAAKLLRSFDFLGLSQVYSGPHFHCTRAREILQKIEAASIQKFRNNEWVVLVLGLFCPCPLAALARQVASRSALDAQAARFPCVLFSRPGLTDLSWGFYSCSGNFWLISSIHAEMDRFPGFHGRRLHCILQPQNLLVNFLQYQFFTGQFPPNSNWHQPESTPSVPLKPSQFFLQRLETDQPDWNGFSGTEGVLMNTASLL